jgi:Cytochrome P460
MTVNGKFVAAAAVAAVAALTTAVSVRAGGDKIMFPAEYAKGAIYMTLDRPDNKQVREYYTSQAAVDAAKKGTPLPAGTVITVVQYAAQLDAEGNPAKDANGRFTRTNTIQGYTVMEKQAGWGSESATSPRPATTSSSPTTR